MQVRAASFDADYAAIRRIRFAVFVDEQQVPEDEELDERDRACLHLLALDDAGTPIGTGRIDLEQGGKIGRVAVLADARGSGVGTALMERFHEIAREHRLNKVWCNAQTGAAAFYAGLGYCAAGERFYEAGIEHVRMERTL